MLVCGLGVRLTANVPLVYAFGASGVRLSRASNAMAAVSADHRPTSLGPMMSGCAIAR